MAVGGKSEATCLQRGAAESDVTTPPPETGDSTSLRRPRLGRGPQSTTTVRWVQLFSHPPTSWRRANIRQKSASVQRREPKKCVLARIRDMSSAFRVDLCTCPAQDDWMLPACPIEQIYAKSTTATTQRAHRADARDGRAAARPEARSLRISMPTPGAPHASTNTAPSESRSNIPAVCTLQPTQYFRGAVVYWTLSRGCGSMRGRRHVAARSTLFLKSMLR